MHSARQRATPAPSDLPRFGAFVFPELRTDERPAHGLCGASISREPDTRTARTCLLPVDVFDLVQVTVIVGDLAERDGSALESAGKSGAGGRSSAAVLVELGAHLECPHRGFGSLPGDPVLR